MKEPMQYYLLLPAAYLVVLLAALVNWAMADTEEGKEE